MENGNAIKLLKELKPVELNDEEVRKLAKDLGLHRPLAARRESDWWALVGLVGVVGLCLHLYLGHIFRADRDGYLVELQLVAAMVYGWIAGGFVRRLVRWAFAEPAPAPLPSTCPFGMCEEAARTGRPASPQSCAACKAELKEMAAKWRRKSEYAFKSAMKEPVEMGRKLIEHGGFCYYNCWQELERFIAKRESPAAVEPSTPPSAH